jgi:hypothetical protein
MCGEILLFTLDVIHSHVYFRHKMNWGTYKKYHLAQDPAMPDDACPD